MMSGLGTDGTEKSAAPGSNAVIVRNGRILVVER